MVGWLAEGKERWIPPCPTAPVTKPPETLLGPGLPPPRTLVLLAAPSSHPSSTSPVSPIPAFSLQLLPSSAPPRSPPPPRLLPAPAADLHLCSLGRWVHRLSQPPRPPPPTRAPIPIVSYSPRPSTFSTTMAHEAGRSSRLGGPCGEPTELGGAVGPGRPGQSRGRRGRTGARGKTFRGWDKMHDSLRRSPFPAPAGGPRWGCVCGEGSSLSVPATRPSPPHAGCLVSRRVRTEL